jgi:hypothetical protein
VRFLNVRPDRRRGFHEADGEEFDSAVLHELEDSPQASRFAVD